ncbi:2-octaprenyl-6-methoxyphenol hydroxylase /2-octaprenyl-3-methyl-6-methoxy-1,4-benzoquinol hydroxylase [Sulfuritortus calidifontis]|uniref:2-octaprenyl-6-methoxyphenol hydroxylase /2-octaprenyl-3-methyl-6-methoxy-1,4-benzoquinol hydroxylase n=1 Tax=Sulfuritortus calidifontis TaxID=1914471 RepID=A0A4R3JYT1_9PROT|nr:FAD-dependent monooxygenase [Sulfuritortus calidifontis]TCS72624.1 2-octaprenyl-6-methoxyphenol hydroxylase /2-octaprenyl-3-methyl-6-methoxy-1,4-benzoquinol hydroxylase [Sulfuritortus calidifontis]
MTEHVDIAIVGGGPVGAALAAALAGGDYRVAVLEARSRLAAQDPRAIALSQGARLILERLGAWSDLADQATAIESIHVSQRGGFGRAELLAAELGVPALGYVTRYGDLYAALAGQLQQSGAMLLTGAQVSAIRSTSAYGVVEFQRDGIDHLLSADLVVLADGGKSLPGRQAVKDYGQTAVICTVTTAQPHRQRAYERFTPEGPMALLPLGEAYALVWTVPNAKAEAVLALTDAAFLARLHERFGERQGRFLTASGRAAFPLRMITSEPAQAPRLLRIGNAAQTLHPVAGQGFNLGLRDAWHLAQLIWDADKAMLGSAEFCARYQARRAPDVRGGMAMTDLMVELFSNDHFVLRHGRGLGLALMDALPPLKKAFARKMMFGAQAW